MQPQRKKAIWWMSPALLEPSDGPWGRMVDFGHDPVKVWKAIIDWAAALKIDRLIPGIEPYMTDRVVNQWGFHYVCRFPNDPEARCFDAETVERNIDQVRRICAYGLEKNVRILAHHYNLMAPERWVMSKPRLAEKYAKIDDPVWGRRFHNDRLGFIVANMCWNDPIYKDFLQRCWQELFQNIPELTGLLITAGEFNYCGCDLCTGGEPVHIFKGPAGPQETAEEAAQRQRRDERRMKMCIDLITTFKENMDKAGKEAIVRTWIMDRWMSHFPKDVQYATKFSLFDACWGGPDPVIHKWIEGGHRMWETMAIEAENSGLTLWHDENWCRTIAERVNALPLEGCIVHINLQWGHTGHTASFAASRNITRFFETLAPSAPAGASADEFAAFFGPEAGAVALKAAALIAEFPLRMTEAVCLRSEGFSFGMPPWFDGHWRWPGVLGHMNYQPQEWTNVQGLTSIYDLTQQVRANPTGYSALIEKPSRSAIALCDAIAARCAEAIALLEKTPESLPGPAAAEWRSLYLSACIAEQSAREHAAVLRARVAWEVVKSQPADAPISAEARDCAARHYAQAIEHLRRQIPRGMEMARIYPDAFNQVTESRETFFRLTLATRLRVREEELRRIRTITGPDWETAMTVPFWPQLPASIGAGAGPAD